MTNSRWSCVLGLLVVVGCFGPPPPPKEDGPLATILLTNVPISGTERASDAAQSPTAEIVSSIESSPSGRYGGLRDRFALRDLTEEECRRDLPESAWDRRFRAFLPHESWARGLY